MRVSVVGYFTGQQASSAADTYTGCSVDQDRGHHNRVGDHAGTRSGRGEHHRPGERAGWHRNRGGGTAFVQVNAYNATANGSLDVYPAGTADPGVAALRYASDDTYRNLVYAPLSSSGRLTITNTGGAPVNLAVYTRGYFMPPAASPVGAEYAPISNVMVYGTASAGQSVAANASVPLPGSWHGGIACHGRQ